MNGLMSAIKNRRGGGLMDEEMMASKEAMVEGGGAPKKADELKSLLSSLDEGQKQMLLKMLSADQKIMSEPDAIAKGAKGPGETAELEEYVSEMEPDDEHESEEEIMQSMLSSSDRTRAEKGVEPKNLGDRVKMGLFNKLKNKKG